MLLLLDGQLELARKRPLAHAQFVEREHQQLVDGVLDLHLSTTGRTEHTLRDSEVQIVP